MANVGSAYVQLMPSMTGFASGIGAEFGGAGTKAGNAFGSGLAGGVGAGVNESSGLLGRLGGIASSVATAAALGFGALTSAVGAIGGAALNAYASYEQLTGGVDKLFGDASGKLQAYAAEAYRTAGMSANDYMTQATSFSASLIQSCAGDTAKAADYANLAMTTMSDNVNVFGSNMGDVQNAFQGFAKQNYTMLDNLKLGYGGTQAEMQRLIADANKLPGVMKDGNDLTIDSYADVIEAIARVQQAQGIAGTTAKEAASTIEGSIGMAKAAWENFVTGLGRDDVDFSEITNQLLESIGAVAQNVAPRVAQIGKSLIEAFPVVLSGLAGVLAPIVSEALATAWGIAVSALSTLGIQLPTVDGSQLLAAFQTIVDTAKGIWDGLTTALAPVGDAFGDFLGRLQDNGTLESLSGLVQEVAGFVGDLGGKLAEAAGSFGQWASESGAAQGAADLLKGAIDGLRSGFEFIRDNGDGIASALVAIGGGFAAIKVGNGISEAVKQLGDAKAAVELAADAMSGKDLVGKIKGISDAFGLLDKGNFASGIGGIAGKISSIASAATKAGGGITGLSTALGLGPWGLVAAAIAAVVTGLVWFFTQTELGQELWGNFTQFLGECWANIQQGFSDFATAIGEFFTVTIPTALQGAGEWFAGLPETIGTALSGAVTAVAEWAVGFGQAALQAGSDFVNWLGQALIALPGNLATWLGTAIGTVAGILVGLALLALEAGANFVTNLGNFLLQLPGNMASWLSSVISNVANWVSEMVSNAQRAGSEFIQNVGNFIQQLPGNVANWLSNIISNVGNWVGQMASNAQRAGSEFIQNVGNFIQQLPGKVAGWLSSVIGSVASFVGDLGNRARQAGEGFLNGIRTGFDNAVNFVSGIPGRILGFFGDMGSLLVSSGKSLLSGFVSGIKQGFSNALGAVKSGLSSIRSFFPFSPAKRGPFSGRGYTTYSGKALMGDFAKSIRAETGNVVAATEEALGAAQSGLSTDVSVMRNAQAITSVTPSDDRANALLERTASLLEQIRDKDSNTYLDGQRVSGALYRRTAIAAAGRGVA